MKKTAFFLALCTGMMLLCGCAGGEKDNAPQAAAKELEESPKMVETILGRIEEVNTVENARAIDDFSVENEMALTMDNLVAYKGDVTNNQADCALVFVALCKDGKAEAVKDELEAYRRTMTGNLYIEFADKVEQAKNARIVVSGNYAIMVMAGVSGPTYEQVDQAISSALQP